jgi:hypothetical protein
MSASEIKTAGDVAHEAAILVSSDRESQHGSTAQNFANIAAVWNGILKASGIAPARDLDGHDVCNLMEGMKIARRYSGSFNPDDYVDGAGYASCAFEVRFKSSGQ